MTAERPRDIHLTRVEKAGRALLSKRIALGEDGRPVSDGSPCAMANGHATRVILSGWGPAGDLADLILDLGSHEALVLGDHVAESDTIEIVKAAHAGDGRHGRTLRTFTFREGEPAAVLLDFDQKAMSDSARARLDACGGFDGALAALIPGYAGLSRVTRASTSAGLRNAETGESFPGSGGRHDYVFVLDGADAPRFLRDLQKRAWLAGLGWIMVSSRGALLVRSIVDVTVGSPERLVFEGMPSVIPPLVQDPGARRPVAVEGDLLDTLSACPPLTPGEEQRYDALVLAAKREKRPEAEAAGERAAESLAKHHGIDVARARAIVAASTRGELWSLDVLHFDDAGIGKVSVADVLADPGRFHGETLADPVEGPGYGRGKARLFWNANDSVVVNSFAHGGCVYTAHHDADHVEQQVGAAGEDAPRVLASLMARAGKIDAVTQERLRALAAKLGRVGKQSVKNDIKAAVKESRRRATAAARDRGDEGRDAGKSGREALVLRSGQRPAQLEAIKARLRIPESVGPGAVVARGQAVAVIKVAVDPVKLRTGEHEISLPAGSAYLAQARPEHVQAQLDRLFAFLKPAGEDLAPVDCPHDLASYVLANGGLLPLQFISRTPVLRPDGSVLDKPGYDAKTGIYYAPEDAFPAIPDAPTRADAVEAMVRIRRPFRGFPFVDDADRDAAVGEVLTLMTRHIVACAPAFVHSATEAGSGKTKLFDTVSIIALGTNAPLMNAAILDDEDELKKVLTTLTLAARPLAVFDNVARGGLISASGISNYLTATIYGDRLLSTNTDLQAATCTVIGITGNKLEVATDHTRRMLRIDLDARVERPELRTFDFDCEAEARADRCALVAAALTLLRAHAAAGWPAVPGRPALGSFADWDRLVAGAIAFAGGEDIVSLLEKTRSDPERDDLAAIMAMLAGIGATSPMKTGEIIAAVEAQSTAALNRVVTGKRRKNGKVDGAQAVEWHELLCRLGPDRGTPNARSIGQYLAKNAGRIVGDLQLVSAYDKHAKVQKTCVKSASKNGPDAGFAVKCGGAHTPSSLEKNKIEKTNLFSPDIARVEETTHNAANPARHANAGNGPAACAADRPASRHEEGTTPPTPGRGAKCAQCRGPVTRFDAGGWTTTKAGELLHNRCVDAWARS